MTEVALFVKLEAKPGKEEDVAAFLKQGASMAQDEAGTTAWFGVRFGPTTFGVFDAFDDEAGRDAHLNGAIAAALMENAAELLAEEPSIEKLDVLGDKLPA